MLSLDELRAEVESGAIDTVIVAFTDMQGRLLGKRLHGEFFLDEHVVANGVEGCNYLLALDMEMDPVPGYEIANWERGYGDFALVPDLATLRRIPWLEATALVLCDVAWHDGSPVAPSPRQVLKRQVERAAELGYTPMLGSELEFYLFRETYAEAHEKGYRDLTPSVPYILDYHILASTYDEPLIRQIRNGDARRRDPRRDSKGEAWPGQHEINFRYADALTMADNHTDLQERREGDRVPERLLAHLHGEAGSHLDRQFLPRPREPLAGRRKRVRGRIGGLRRLPRRADRVLQGARRLPGARRQLVQALRRRKLGADDAGLGARQPDGAASGSSATATPSAPRRASPAATATRTSPSRR